MANLNLPPPPRVPVGSVTVGGQTVQIILDPEWARYFDSLNRQVNVTTADIGAPTLAGVALAFEGGDSEGSDTLIPGPKGPQGAAGAVIALLQSDDQPTEMLSRPVNGGTPLTSSDVIPVANGGTGDTGTALTSYTPTITAGSGTFTTVSGAGSGFKQLGKLVFLSVLVSVTTNGTAAGSIQVPLPAGMTATSRARQFIGGREDATSGNQVQGIVEAGATSITVVTYSNGYPASNGSIIALTGWIEIA